MAKAYVNGELIDVPEPAKKTINRPAPQSVTKGRKPVSASPKGRVTAGGQPVKTVTGQARTPSPKAPRGFSRGGMGGAPRPVGGAGTALGALGSGMMMPALAETALNLTPEGYGPKAPQGPDQIGPRDYNQYQGALPFLGSFGAGVEKMAGDVGQVLGELSTYLPESMGGIKGADGKTVTLAPDQWQELKDEQYGGMFGVDQETYGYLASGSEEMPTGTPALPPMEMMASHGPGYVPNESPIEVTDDGKVKPNPRYGMPDRPDVGRRQLDERFGAITGGAIPETMEGFMVANFLQNQLRMDDSRRVGDAKDLYEADLGALPNFMREDRAREMMPYEQDSKSAYAEQARALAGMAPTEKAYKEAQTSKLQAETSATLSKEESKEMRVHERAMQDAATLAKEYLKMQGIVDPSPEDLAAIQNVIYNRQMEAYANTKKGKKAKMTDRTEGDEGGWFSDPTPAIPYGVVYE